jgi:hypothetical protein
MLDKLTVAQLRSVARKYTSKTPLPRPINFMRKAELLAYIRAVRARTNTAVRYLRTIKKRKPKK